MKKTIREKVDLDLGLYKYASYQEYLYNKIEYLLHSQKIYMVKKLLEGQSIFIFYNLETQQLG